MKSEHQHEDNLNGQSENERESWKRRVSWIFLHYNLDLQAEERILNILGFSLGGRGAGSEVFFWWLARRVWCIFETPWHQPGYYWCAAREAHGTPDPPNNRIYHNATHSPTFTEKETLPSWNYWLGEFSSLKVLICEADEHKALDWVPAKFFYSSVLTFSPKWYF